MLGADHEAALGGDDGLEEREEEPPERHAVELVDEPAHALDALDDDAVVALAVGPVKVAEDERAGKGREEGAQVEVVLGRARVGREVQRDVERLEARVGVERRAAGEVDEAGRGRVGGAGEGRDPRLDAVEDAAAVELRGLLVLVDLAVSIEVLLRRLGRRLGRCRSRRTDSPPLAPPPDDDIRPHELPHLVRDCLVDAHLAHDELAPCSLHVGPRAPRKLAVADPRVHADEVGGPAEASDDGVGGRKEPGIAAGGYEVQEVSSVRGQD